MSGEDCIGQETLQSLRARLAAATCRADDESGHAGEYVGQESFMISSEILSLAGAAGVAPRSRVLDLCCGRGGPTLYLAQEIGCEVVGVDLSPEVVLLAREAAVLRGLSPRADFRVANALRLPFSETFDAALVFETMLAFRDKDALLREVRRLLSPGGRLGMTLEEGRPLSREEQSRLSDGEDVWLTTEDEFLALLGEAGFRVCLREDHTASHAEVARRLAEAFREDCASLSTTVGKDVYAGLFASHERWAEWLDAGRVRKLAIVAEKVPDTRNGEAA